MNLFGGKSVPVTILTGFLGAGKTTLLNRILNGGHGLRVAVLVNDFGAINIDADLIVGVKDEIMSLANGCVCCTIRDDLVETVVQVINRPEAPEYILLEASGVADPSGIALTFVDSELRDRIWLDSIICVVDADQVFAHPEVPTLMELKLRQVAFSDMLILNKADLAGPRQLRKVREWLNGSFRRLRIVEASHCDVPLEILLSVGSLDPVRHNLNRRTLKPVGCRKSNRCDGHHTSDHSKTFNTWSYETTQPLCLEALWRAARKLPENIYRAKGFVYASETPDRPAVLQVVGRRVDIAMQGEWGHRPRRTQIVAIGGADTIDARLLEKMFAACISVSSG